MNNALILENSQIADCTYCMTLRMDSGTGHFLPGQFAHVKLPGSAMLLRRPISINHIDPIAATAQLVYQVKGEGTRLLSTLQEGQPLDVLAPLGRGFWRPEGAKRAAVIGGGIGAAPLRALLEAWQDIEFDVFLGFRSASCAYQVGDFTQLSHNLFLCTDDGTLGEQGLVTGLLKKQLDGTRYDALYACGPVPMLKALKKLLYGTGIHCQASLEERMGCGIGACLVCNCKVKEGDGWHYRRVCADGPVFDLMEVELDG